MSSTLHARPSDPQALKAAAAVAAAGSAGGAVGSGVGPPPPEFKATSTPGVRLDLGGEAGVLDEPNAIARYLGENEAWRARGRGGKREVTD